MKIAIVLEALTGSFVTDMDRASKDAQKRAKEIERAYSDMGKKIGGVLAAVVSAATIKRVADMADEYGQLASRLRMVTDSAQEYEATQARLNDIARRTYRSAQENTEVFLKSAGALKELGFQTRQVLDLTEAVGLGMVVSATSTEKATSVIDQFGKAMELGKLSGESFNTVVSNAPALAEAMAKSLGVTRAELRKMAADGKLTAELVLPALTGQLEDLRKKADEMPKTIGDAMTVLRNALFNIAGYANEASGATGGIADAIENLAEVLNRQEVKDGFVSIAMAAVDATAKAVELFGQVQKLADFAGRYAGMKVTGFVDQGDTEILIARQKELYQELYRLENTEANLTERIMERFGTSRADRIQQIREELLSIGDSHKAIGELRTAQIEADEAAAKAAAELAEAERAGRQEEIRAARERAEAAALEADAKKKAADAARKAARDAEALALANAKAQAAYNVEIMRWAAQLLPDAERAAAEYNIRVQEMIAEQQAGKMTADQLARALGILGTQYQRNARTIAANNDVLGRIRQSYAEQAGAIGLTGRELAAYHAVLEATRDAHATFGDELADMPGYLEQVQDAAREGATGLYDMQQEALDLENILARFDSFGMGGLVRDIERVTKALGEAEAATGDAFDPKLVEALKWELGNLKQEALVYATDALGQGITSLKSMASEGSKAYKALEVAQTALNLATAIGAIANQGMGDPYTAFARIAAMAAMMSQLVDGIGSLTGGSGGPSANSAAYRQEHQGTGTVLGDAAAKSESIARAVEITANATQQLVGINRSMLNAMNAMAAGLAGASTLLARGGYGEFDALGNGQQGGLMTILGGLFSPIGGSMLTRAFANIFGGKESLRDEGIRIVGGTLSSMINDIMVQSYQSIHRSGGWFRSSRDYDRFNDLGDDAAAQFQLVLGSMADAVRAAADALGLNMDAINAAIAAYRIEEIRISTMDLSAEEAQKELEAVFGSIFDGLAGAVVPFIGQFQQVGEGLGETLIRVATGVQVTQEAVIQLGFALDETDPEKFAQISEGLMALMGGIDGFIEGMSSFVNNFATDEHKFAVAQDAITRAFEQFGLAVPETRDAMWEMMQGLDATTEAGRQQIAMLLQLADVSDSYYQMLEDRASNMARIDAALADGAWGLYLDGLSESARAVAELTRYYDDLRASFEASGATAEQLTALEDQRATAMGRLLAAQAEQAAAEAAAIAGILDGNAWTLYLDGLSESARAVAEINRRFGEQRDALTLAGASSDQLETLESQRIETLRRLAAAQSEVAAIEAQRARQTVADQMRMDVDAAYGRVPRLNGDGPVDEVRRRLSAISHAARQYQEELLAAGGFLPVVLGQVREYREQMENALRFEVVNTALATFADDIAAMNAELASMGMSDYAVRQMQIAAETQEALAVATAAGATPAQLLAIEIAGLERAAAAAALAAANFANELSGWEFEDYLAGLSDADAQRARVDRQWEERYLRAVEIFGEGSEEAIRVLGLWESAVARLGDSTTAAVDRMQRATMLMGDILDGVKTWAEKLNESIAHLRPGDEMERWISELSGLPTLAQKAVRRPLAEVVQLVRDEYLGKAAELRQQLDAAWAQYEALPWYAQAEMHTLQGQIAALEQAMGSITGQMGNALETLKRMYIASLQGVRDYLDSMLLGDLSALTPAERIAEAWDQLTAAVEGGEGDAATRLADTYLRLLREFEASGDDYNTGFYAVRDLLEGMFDIDWDALLGPDAAGATDSDNIAHMAGAVDAQLAAAQVANDWLAQIAANTGGGWGLPSYDVGTYNVPQTGPAILHAGEMVLPRPMADAMRQGAFGGGGDTKALEAKLDGVIQRLDKLDRTTAAGAQQISSTVAKTGEISDRNADASRARHALAQRRGVTA